MPTMIADSRLNYHNNNIISFIISNFIDIMEHLREQTYTSTTNTQAFAYDKQNELLNKEESPQNINQQYKI